MKNKTRIDEIADDFSETSATGDSTSTNSFEDIIPFINQGTVIPIISNSFRFEEIFNEEVDDTVQNPSTITSGDEDARLKYDDEEDTIDELITRAWAKSIKYPLPDKHNLARVAQFHLVEEAKKKSSLFLAKRRYIDFMKRFVLFAFKGDDNKKKVVEDLNLKFDEKSFSKIIRELGIPVFPENKDPLELLARLDLPIYITTSYYDFMERALIKAGKNPRTQICFWSGKVEGVKPEHVLDKDYWPSQNNPMVYHLYGFEDYPETMVLSEDDYMNFLISVMGHTDNLNPIVPASIRERLPAAKMLLLGYHLRDWDFRVLFRFLTKFRFLPQASVLVQTQRSTRGMVIQLKETDVGDDEIKTLDYLQEYFDQKDFEVRWQSVDDFIRSLYREWNKVVRGES
jgi:hypothetical protein